MKRPIEKWGRGTNRVVALCLEAGIGPPEFDKIIEAACPPKPWRRRTVMTLRVREGRMAGPEAGSKLESRPESLDDRLLRLLKGSSFEEAELSSREFAIGVTR